MDPKERSINSHIDLWKKKKIYINGVYLLFGAGWEVLSSGKLHRGAFPPLTAGVVFIWGWASRQDSQ